MKALDQLSGLREDTVDYLRLRWAGMRLRAVDKLSDSISKAIGWVVCLLFVAIALVFMMVALALWIGQRLGNPWLGFLVAGGGFLVLGVILYFVARAVAAGPLVRHFADMLFTSNDEYYGTQD